MSIGVLTCFSHTVKSQKFFFFSLSLSSFPFSILVRTDSALKARLPWTDSSPLPARGRHKKWLLRESRAKTNLWVCETDAVAASFIFMAKHPHRARGQQQPDGVVKRTRAEQRGRETSAAQLSFHIKAVVAQTGISGSGTDVGVMREWQ